MNEAALTGAALRFALALGGGLALIIAAERRRLASFGSSVLFLRWRTWAISAPLFALAASGPEAAAVLFVVALSLQATRELAALVRLPRPYRLLLYAACVASAPLAATSTMTWVALPTMVFLSASLLATVAQDTERGHQRVANVVLGFTWIPWMFAFFLLIKASPGGRELLLATGMAVALSDVCAFALGKLLGSHALAPRLSPNKTWEGAAGNVAGAYLGFGVMWSAFASDLLSATSLVLPAVIASGCLWGDLFESLVKRHCGAKDAGSWLPGFGGLLDRVDSLLLALPLVYGATVLLT